MLCRGLANGLILPDAESRAWLDALHADGHEREDAIARLHELLLRAARFELARRRAKTTRLRGVDLEDLALQSADDALVALLGKLDEFRGHSRFTTWAYKFAILEAAVNVRRRAWQEKEIPFEPATWPQLADGRPLPDAEAEQRELLEGLRGAIVGELTPHQREVLVAVALNEVPIDVLAERLERPGAPSTRPSTTRGESCGPHSKLPALTSGLGHQELEDEREAHERCAWAPARPAGSSAGLRGVHGIRVLKRERTPVRQALSPLGAGAADDGDDRPQGLRPPAARTDL
jgi:RNA polymerase sigma-70 factor (ECF subfamily)